MYKFTDMHNRPIFNGAEVHYNGHFPDQIPVEKHIRNGVAIIDGDKLIFAVIINNQLQGIGLYWEFDGEPCYDLIVNVTTPRFRVEFYSCETDKLEVAFEADDLKTLDALWANTNYLDYCYGVEIDNYKTNGGTNYV